MNATAQSILTEQDERREAAREQRRADPHVLVSLRIKPHKADALDAAATAAGLTIDQYVERLVEGRT